jgi:hypothetical protein
LKDGLSSKKWTEISEIIENNDNIPNDSSYFEVSLYLNGQPYIGILQLINKTLTSQFGQST